MFSLKREVLAIGSDPGDAVDRLSQCLVCGAFTWSMDDENGQACRCYDGAIDPLPATIIAAA